MNGILQNEDPWEEVGILMRSNYVDEAAPEGGGRLCHYWGIREHGRVPVQEEQTQVL